MSRESQPMRWNWVAHALAVLSAIMLIVPGLGWLFGGSDVIAERTGFLAQSEAEMGLAFLVGQFKGLLDLWPIAIALPLALWKSYREAALVWLVAAVVIPGADLYYLMIGASGGPLLVHGGYAVLLALTGVAYGQLAMEERAA